MAFEKFEKFRAVGKRKGGHKPCEMLGEKGVQVTSKTIWRGKGRERLDIENPNPGKRPGQIHYQDNNNNKYLYNPETGVFKDAPKYVNNRLQDPSFKKAIEKGLTQYLGEGSR